MAALVIGKLLGQNRVRRSPGGVRDSDFVGDFGFLGASSSDGFGMALSGVILWGIGLGAQDSALKAMLAGMVPPERRSPAFGVFDTGFGIAWFAGSVRRRFR